MFHLLTPELSRRCLIVLWCDGMQYQLVALGSGHLLRTTFKFSHGEVPNFQMLLLPLHPLQYVQSHRPLQQSHATTGCTRGYRINTGSDAGRTHDFVEPGHAESSWS